MVISPYFPTVPEDAVTRLRGAEIGNARDPLVRAFVDDLVFGWPDANHAYHSNDQVLVALEATLHIHRPIVLPRLILAIEKLAKSDVADAVRFAAALTLRISEAGERVDDATQVVLRAWLLQEASADKGQTVKAAMQIGWWRECALQAVGTLTAEHLARVTEPPPEMITHAAQIYATASNWDHANALAASVANPLADRFSPQDIAHVMNASHNGADLRGSHGFREFIGLLYDKNPINNAELEALMSQHHLEVYIRGPQIVED